MCKNGAKRLFGVDGDGLLVIGFRVINEIKRI